VIYIIILLTFSALSEQLHIEMIITSQNTVHKQTRRFMKVVCPTWNASVWKDLYMSLVI